MELADSPSEPFPISQPANASSLLKIWCNAASQVTGRLPKISVTYDAELRATLFNRLLVLGHSPHFVLSGTMLTAGRVVVTGG